ncbi:hypothetical protein LCGC14_2762970 [marine sediment metagenome]|uniref:Uncharacterized protein n=1 Tax=marine sediment metagenome TaxID=412755 RepID=A0A0F9B724_9ZZZZ
MYKRLLITFIITSLILILFGLCNSSAFADDAQVRAKVPEPPAKDKPPSEPGEQEPPADKEESTKSQQSESSDDDDGKESERRKKDQKKASNDNKGNVKDSPKKESKTFLQVILASLSKLIKAIIRFIKEQPVTALFIGMFASFFAFISVRQIVRKSTN